MKIVSKLLNVSLGKTLKGVSVGVAVVGVETLWFFFAGEPEWGILNPFAAMMFLVASPFFYWMGKLAR